MSEQDNNEQPEAEGSSLAPASGYVDSWQPIETAPRDGAEMDVWMKAGYRDTDLRFRNGLLGKEKPVHGCGVIWVTTPIQEATHWRPRPTPPHNSRDQLPKVD